MLGEAAMGLFKRWHASADDIRWLQRITGVAPVKDGTTRFMELLQGIRNGSHTLPDSFVYLLILGLFSNFCPLYFESTKKFFSEKMGLVCHIAEIHSEASVVCNALALKEFIEELYRGSGKRVMLLGHSKGGVDAAAALAIYSSELEGKVAGLALVQSPYGGTPMASVILHKGLIACKETRKVVELFCKLIKGDMQALEDLTYEKRKEFIMKYKLPDHIPLISFHSKASKVARLSNLSLFSHTIPGTQLPVIAPLASLMAISALGLHVRYGEKSDGLVTCNDAIVPGSVVVHPDMKLDHTWMVHSSWKKHPTQPDSTQMCETLLSLLVELGDERA